MLKKIFIILLFIVLGVSGCGRNNLDKSLVKLGRDRTISDKEVLNKATEKIFSYYGGSFKYELKKYDKDYTIIIEHRYEHPKKVISRDTRGYRDFVLNKAAEIIRCYFAHFQDRNLMEVKYLIKQVIVKEGRQKLINLCEVRASRDMLMESPGWELKYFKKTIDYIKRNWFIEVDSFSEVENLLN